MNKKTLMCFGASWLCVGSAIADVDVSATMTSDWSWHDGELWWFDGSGDRNQKLFHGDSQITVGTVSLGYSGKQGPLSYGAHIDLVGVNSQLFQDIIEYDYEVPLEIDYDNSFTNRTNQLTSSAYIHASYEDVGRIELGNARRVDMHQSFQDIATRHGGSVLNAGTATAGFQVYDYLAAYGHKFLYLEDDHEHAWLDVSEVGISFHSAPYKGLSFALAISDFDADSDETTASLNSNSLEFGVDYRYKFTSLRDSSLQLAAELNSKDEYGISALGVFGDTDILVSHEYSPDWRSLDGILGKDNYRARSTGITVTQGFGDYSISGTYIRLNQYFRKDTVSDLSQGISAGIDYRLADGLTLSGGLGYVSFEPYEGQRVPDEDNFRINSAFGIKVEM